MILKDKNIDILIVGAGPAGLAAAIKAKESGASNVLIVERDEAPGGLLQCKIFYSENKRVKHRHTS